MGSTRRATGGLTRVASGRPAAPITAQRAGGRTLEDRIRAGELGTATAPRIVAPGSRVGRRPVGVSTPRQAPPLSFSGPQTAPAPTQRELPSNDALFDAASRWSGQNLANAFFQRGMNRLTPEFDRQRSTLTNELTARGLPVGDEADLRSRERLSRSQNEALENLNLSAQQVGANEQSRLASLVSALRGQEFGEGMQERQFAANEAQRAFQNALSRDQFGLQQQLGLGGLGLQRDQFGLAQQLGLGNLGLAQDRFDQSEAARLFGQGLARDQFGANEAARLFQQGLADRQFGLQDFLGRHRAGLADRQFNFGRQQYSDMLPFNQLMMLLSGWGGSFLPGQVEPGGAG